MKCMTSEMYYEYSSILALISTIATVVGLVFACVQLWQIKRNRKKQYDQSRREKTVEMVIRYTHDVNKETKATEKIVSQLNDEQCQDLYNGNAFTVDSKTKEQLCKICPYKKECLMDSEKPKDLCVNEKKECVIDGELLYFVRNNIIGYLNSLESVLLAWQLGIVDQDALEEQFNFLDKKRQKERALETFRMIAGNGKSYPAIEKFYQHLDRKRLDEARKSLKRIIK